MDSEPIQERRARFVALVGEHESWLLRAARRMTGSNFEQAQDLVQEALVRAYEAFMDGRYRDESAPKAWFLRIMTNTFINEYKRRKRWMADVDLDTLLDESRPYPSALRTAPADSPEGAFLAGIMDEALERALGLLPPDQRLCVLLVDVEGAEYAEAAAAMGTPVGTVRSRLARARLKLFDLLQDYARERGIVHA